MKSYAFTENQLRRLLQDNSILEKEYHQVHGKPKKFSQLAAIQDTIDGLDAERELYDNGDIEKLTMQLEE